MFALCLIFLLLRKIAATHLSAKHLVSANIGDIVTLPCSHENSLALKFLWYKQTLGEHPKILSTFNDYDNNATFLNEFKDDHRFSVQIGKTINKLSISDLRLSDSATYYCGSSYSNKVEFGKGFIVIVKGSGFRKTSVVQQPESESVHPGDSVSLNCTINTGTCEGEHSVYWFRRDSGESPPGIISTNGDRSGQCMKSSESGSPTQSCVYNLPKRNLSLSDTGTYYCAVESGGEILFGNGTKLEVLSDQNRLLLVYCLGVALGVSFILIIVLTCIMYKIKKRTCLQCRGYIFHSQAPGDPSMGHDADNLQYVALNLNKNMSRRQRKNTEEETVVLYSSIRQ
ncbi:uncharacterized protein LOC105008666 isoform X1 [Esox lucius]|uniref:uncharacterized protein LOC105008666 isoform X1 n=1 Tax=Esox lucius TaxID=8010 RepID=UPI001476841D|nr:uncharacterized protein LOC105008666 isoform X1 [Esox lucius]